MDFNAARGIRVTNQGPNSRRSDSSQGTVVSVVPTALALLGHGRASNELLGYFRTPLPGLDKTEKHPLMLLPARST